MDILRKGIYTLLVALLITGGFFTYLRIRDWRNDSVILHTQNDETAQHAAQIISNWDAKYKPIIEKLTATIESNNAEIISLQNEISKIKLLTPAQIANLQSLECEKRYSIVVDQFTFCTDKVAKQEKAIDLFKGSEIALQLKVKTLEDADNAHKIEYEDLTSEYLICTAKRNQLQEKLNRRLILYGGVGYSAFMQNTIISGSGNWQVKIAPAVQLGIGWILWRF